MGLSLASIFVVYTGESVARTFLLVGVLGLGGAMLFNLFLASTALEWAISVIGVLVFTGLTAYDAQKIKNMYYAGDDAEIGTKKAVMGALNLYLDFINLFIFM